jgi:hypothetical protein
MKRLMLVLGLFALFTPQSSDSATLKATVNNSVTRCVGQGWCSATYVPHLRKFLAIFVNHYSPGGYQDNSLRAFDPATGTVEYLHPKDVPGAPRDRDNHNMLYNPYTHEIWIMESGGQICNVDTAYAYKDTPPSYGAVAWTAHLDNAAFGAAADIKNWPSDYRKWNAMVDWHDSLDMGVCFSGVPYTGMGVSNDLYLIKPNPTPNEERYVFINAGNYDALLAPPGYVKNYIYTSTFNGRHNGRILGNHFYFLSVDSLTSLTDNSDGTYTLKIDFYRYDLLGPVGSSSMTKMAPLTYTVTRSTPPSKDYGMNFPCVTADSRLNLILVRLQASPPNNLYAYSPGTDTWHQVEPDVPVRYLRLGACDYSPDHGENGVHAYQDGITNPENSYDPNKVWSTISLYWDSAGTGSENAAVQAREQIITASPNPFKAAVKIAVSGQQIADSFSKISIYDIKGKMVHTLSATSDQLTAGFTWNAAALPSGTYIVRVSVNGRTYTRPVVLMK